MSNSPPLLNVAHAAGVRLSLFRRRVRSTRFRGIMKGAMLLLLQQPLPRWLDALAFSHAYPAKGLLLSLKVTNCLFVCLLVSFGPTVAAVYHLIFETTLYSIWPGLSSSMRTATLGNKVVHSCSDVSILVSQPVSEIMMRVESFCVARTERTNTNIVIFRTYAILLNKMP